MADFRFLPDGYDWNLSLSKLTGKKIADIVGMVSREFDDPCFTPQYIVFEDGSQLGCEGEHDFPYLTVYSKWPMPEFKVNVETIAQKQQEEEDE